MYICIYIYIHVHIHTIHVSLCIYTVYNITCMVNTSVVDSMHQRQLRSSARLRAITELQVILGEQLKGTQNRPA